MFAFVDSLGIANRALDHLGLPHILDVNEDSLRNSTIANAYDKLREAEFERNIWKFAKRKVLLRPITATSRLLAPQAWNEDETYLPGSIVSDARGDLWVNWKADNFGLEPGVDDGWDSYYGPMAVDVWSSGVSYYAGEMVYKKSLYDGSFAIFMSTYQGNSDDPDTTTAWSATATYGLDDRVYYSGSMWRSLITLNQNLTPSDNPNPWSEGAVYSTSDQVVASDGFIYTALPGVPVGLDPVDDDGTFWSHGAAAAWARTNPTLYSSSNKWVPIFANMTNLANDRLEVVPTSITGGRALNAFRYPAGCLRMARVGYRFHQGPNDYEPHGDYITSADAMILLEFCADIKDVRKMDAMFCEGFAVRIAMSTCKKLTGSEDSLKDLGALYNKFMNEARLVNGIEMGPEEADEDEYITIRTGGPGGFTSGATNWWN